MGHSYLYRGPPREHQDRMRAVGRETLREAGDLIYISCRFLKFFYYFKIIDFKYVYVCLLVCTYTMCVQGTTEVK